MNNITTALSDKFFILDKVGWSSITPDDDRCEGVLHERGGEGRRWKWLKDASLLPVCTYVHIIIVLHIVHASTVCST